jgi:hypothetical protein
MNRAKISVILVSHPELNWGGTLIDPLPRYPAEVG